MTDETYVDWSGREQEDADPRDALEPKSVLDHDGYRDTDPDPQNRRPEMEPASAFQQEDPGGYTDCPCWRPGDDPCACDDGNHAGDPAHLIPPSLGEVSFEQSDLPDPEPGRGTDADAMAVLAGRLGHDAPTPPALAADLLAWAEDAIRENADHYRDNGFGSDTAEMANSLYWLAGKISDLNAALQAANEAIPPDPESYKYRDQAAAALDMFLDAMDPAYASVEDAIYDHQQDWIAEHGYADAATNDGWFVDTSTPPLVSVSTKVYGHGILTTSASKIGAYTDTWEEVAAD